VDQQTAIEELHKLSSEVDAVSELPALKPIYFRLDQISKQFPNDFDVQVVASELKQRLVSHGQKLKDSALGATGMAPITSSSPVAPPPPAPSPVPPPPPQQPSGVAPPMTSSQMPAPSAHMSGMQPSSPSNTGFGTPPNVAVATPPSMKAKVPSGNRPTSFQTSAAPPPQKPPSAPNFKRALMIGAGLGVAVFLVIFVFIVQVARNRNIDEKKEKGNGTGVVVEITTVPEGAQVQISNQERMEKCKSNCKVELPPGNYQVTALLDGYDPTATGVTVAAGPPIPVSLALTAQAQTLRILSDVPGKVLMDGKPAGDIQEGQFILDRVPLGDHTVTVAGQGSEASFAFSSTAGRAPRITTPATAKNLLAVLVAGSGNQARLHTSSGPLKVQLDGQAKGEVTPAGSDLNDISAGEHDLIVGEGKDAKKIILSFAQTPMLTAYLKSDVNAGFLVVVTEKEDDVSVSVDGRVGPRKTSRGQLRIQLPPGKYKIKPSKEGFADQPEQIAEIKKGEEAKLVFPMKALPRMAMLKVSGATPGANVSIDRNVVGKVGPDGTFSTTVGQPGDKTIEFSLTGYSSRPYQKTFKAGETITITDAVLAQAIATLRLTIVPPLPESKVTVRKEGEQPRPVNETSLTGLTPGTYVFLSRAQGYSDRTERVTVAGGDNKAVDLTLKKDAVVIQQPTVRNGTISDLDGSFTRDGEAYVQKGPKEVMLKFPQTAGVVSFTVRPVKGKRVRWMVNYKDARNYAFFELEKNKITRREVVNGRDRKLGDNKFPDQEAIQVQIDVRNGALIHRVNVGGNWTVVDNWVDGARNFGEGRFGFVVEGKDEIALSNFTFVPSK
jgi:hypothetical protein